MGDHTAEANQAEADPSPQISAHTPSGVHKPTTRETKNSLQKLFYLKFFDPTKPSNTPPTRQPENNNQKQKQAPQKKR
jgi:hypothetical protein